MYTIFIYIFHANVPSPNYYRSASYLSDSYLLCSFRGLIFAALARSTRASTDPLFHVPSGSENHPQVLRDEKEKHKGRLLEYRKVNVSICKVATNETRVFFVGLKTLIIQFSYFAENANNFV